MSESQLISRPASPPIQAGRRRMALALPVLACGLMLPSARAATAAAPDLYQVSRPLMGTQLDLALHGKNPSTLADAADAALREMARLEAMMSRYRPDSALNAIQLGAGLHEVAVPPELMQVLLMARQAAQCNPGQFDPTVGSLCDWDFDPAHPHLPEPAQIARQLPLVNAQHLILNPRRSTAYLTQRGMRLDLGGIAKLPILQAGMDVLQQHGVRHAMINGGGDVLVSSPPDQRPWRIGLRDPRQPERLLGSIALHRGFVASSGDYERYFMHDGQRMHHILDPKTGYPAHGPHGVVLVSEQLSEINGLGAAIMVAGAEAGRRQLAGMPHTDALIAGAGQGIWLSAGMQQRLQAV